MGMKCIDTIHIAKKKCLNLLLIRKPKWCIIIKSKSYVNELYMYIAIIYQSFMQWKTLITSKYQNSYKYVKSTNNGILIKLSLNITFNRNEVKTLFYTFTKTLPTNLSDFLCQSEFRPWMWYLHLSSWRFPSHWRSQSVEHR